MKIDEIEKDYIYHRDGKCCYFCGKPLDTDQVTFDHYLPKSRSGTEDLFNLVICCKRCNKNKGNRMPEDVDDVILKLFLKAVSDNKIKGCNLKLQQKLLREQLLTINRLEAINEYYVFQSDRMRFYVKDNKVYKLVHVHTSKQIE